VYALRAGSKAPNVALPQQTALDEGGETVDYSTTNVQVEGVDEPDIVKTDGTYLYILAKGSVFIVNAYPASEASVLSQISPSNVSISNLFISDDRLVLFGNTYNNPILYDDGIYLSRVSSWWWGGDSQAVMQIYDISDKGNPTLTKDIKINGSYFDARMIGYFVYVVITEYTYQIYQAIDDTNVIVKIPELCIDNIAEEIAPDNIYYVDVPEVADTMTHVLSINIDTEEVNEKSFLIGSSQTMYVSQDNIFLATAHYPYYPLGMYTTSSSTGETTILHKIAISSGDISYVSQGEVPGHILNQFSMDEYDGYFRIATTIGFVSGFGETSQNNIYILDENLKRVSQIENIAPGEQIHSARFMGEKAYLVTFEKIDPFFTIDLSDPTNPQILGALKIPGYSDYLHPYDDTHIIGIGKDTVEPEEDEESWGKDFSWYQGLKIALFDVSDFENPVEMAKIVIGDRGTDSPALHDHKAFLFDREKGLLVIPVSLYEIPQEVKDEHPDYTGSIYGEFTFQGAYVYHLTLENGFEYVGRITHQSEEQQQQTGEYWYWGSYNTDITRSLYIGNVLYTISGSMVKMNDLSNLDEINSISFE